MRTKITAAIVFIFIIIGLLPFVDGLLLKQSYIHFISVLPQVTHTKIEIVEYHTGWIHSYAKIRITVSSQPNTGPNNAHSFVLNQKLTHGPVVFNQNTPTLALASIESSFELSDALKKFSIENLKAQGILRINTLATFNHHWYSQISTPVFITLSIPFQQITWQGIKGSVDIIAKNDLILQTSVDLTLEPLSYIKNTTNLSFTKLEIAPISIKSHYTRTPSLNLWNGDSSISMPTVTIKKNGSSALIDGINISQSSNLDAHSFYQNTFKFYINKLTATDSLVGVISPAALSLSLNNFNAKGVSDLFNAVQKQAGQFPPGIERQNMQSLVLNIFTPSSTVNMHINIQTASGNWLSDLNITMPQNMQTSGSLPMLFTNANLQSNFEISTSLVDTLIQAYTKNKTATLPMPVTPQSAQVNNAANDTPFNQMLITYMQEGKISLDISMQVMGIRDQHLASDQFNAEIDQLSLPKDVSATIKQQYNFLQNEAQMQAQRAQKNPAVIQKSMVDAMYQSINNWIAQGYLTQQNNTYHFTITFNKGVLLINGKTPPPNMNLQFFKNPMPIPIRSQ